MIASMVKPPGFEFSWLYTKVLQSIARLSFDFTKGLIYSVWFRAIICTCCLLISAVPVNSMKLFHFLLIVVFTGNHFHSIPPTMAFTNRIRTFPVVRKPMHLMNSLLKMPTKHKAYSFTTASNPLHFTLYRYKSANTTLNSCCIYAFLKEQRDTMICDGR